MIYDEEVPKIINNSVSTSTQPEQNQEFLENFDHLEINSVIISDKKHLKPEAKLECVLQWLKLKGVSQGNPLQLSQSFKDNLHQKVLNEISSKIESNSVILKRRKQGKLSISI